MSENPEFVWLLVFGIVVAVAVITRIIRKSAQRTSAESTGEKRCQECGAAIRAMAEICPKCGVRQFAA